MLGVDKGLGLWYTCVILDKEMCIEYHITSPLSVGYDSTEYYCRGGLQQYIGCGPERGRAVVARLPHKQKVVGSNPAPATALKGIL